MSLPPEMQRVVVQIKRGKYVDRQDNDFLAKLDSTFASSATRRQVLRYSLGLGVGLTLLSACGDDEEDEGTEVTPDDSSGAAGTEQEAEDTPEGNADEPQYGGRLEVALSGELLTLDMHKVSATNLYMVGWLMYEALFAWDEEYAVIPMLAESFEVSDDGLTYSIKLREGVPFHNGEEMTASDVIASIERWAEDFGFAQAIMTATDELNEVDDYNIEFVLNRPYGTLIPALTLQGRGCAIYPQSVIEASTLDDLAEPVGTGPYQFVEWQRDRYILLERFEDYAALDGEPNGYGGHKYAYLDEIRFAPVPDESARQAGLSTGEYHYLETVPSDLFQVMEGDSNVVAEKLPPISWSVFILNMRSPIMGDIKVRQAFQAALDMEPIMQAGFGEGLFRLDPGLMTQETVWYTDAGAELYNQADPERARQLLEEAGYDGQPIVWTATQEYSDHYDRTFVASQQLEDAGFVVDLQVKDWATILDEQSRDDVWDVTTTGTVVRPDPSGLFLLNVCDVAGWWCDDEVMELVEQLRTETGFETRYEIFEQIQQLVYDQVPFVKNGEPFALTARYHTVHNLSPLLLIGPILWNVWMEQ